MLKITNPSLGIVISMNEKIMLNKNILNDENIQKILSSIDEQVAKHLKMKKGIRKKVKKIVEKIRKIILHKIYFKYADLIKKYNYESNYGCDIFGRDVEDGLNKYIKSLNLDELKINTLIVLGSRVKNRWTPESDIDLTLITDNLPKKGDNAISRRLYYSKIGRIFSDKPFYLGAEISLCYSKKEFIEKLHNFDIHALDAVSYGKVIYDDGFWITIEKEYAQLVEKYGLDPTLLKEKVRLV